MDIRRAADHELLMSRIEDEMNAKQKIAELEKQLAELQKGTEPPVLISISGKQQKIVSKQWLGGRMHVWVNGKNEYIPKIPVIRVADK